MLTQDPDHPFVTKSGVRQGGPESPPLFNLYIDWAMRVFMYECEQNNQIHFIFHKYRISNTATTRAQRANYPACGEGEKIDWSGYADDLELFFQDNKSLQLAINLLQETLQRYYQNKSYKNKDHDT